MSDAGGHGGGGGGTSWWMIIVAVIVLIVLAIYTYSTASKLPQDGTKRQPLDIIGIPQGSGMFTPFPVESP